MPFVSAVDVDEDEAEDLLNRVTEYFQSKSLQRVLFLTSPLTRPKSFTSLLEDHGFQRWGEESVMVFKGEHLEDKLNPEINVEEISETEVDTYANVTFAVEESIEELTMESPVEWKERMRMLDLECLRRGWKLYLAYVEGKPVGVCSLVSLVKIGHIHWVATLKEYRRRGIGTTLLVHSILDSIHEGNNLHTLSVGKENANAVRLYRKIGFVADYTIPWYTKELQSEN